MPADTPVAAPTPPAVAPPLSVAVASEGRGPEPASVPPAVSPADAEHLGNRIAALASRIHAATYELLVLIRDFDAAGAWSGFASCAVWLSWRTGLAPVAAREHVRVAHALAADLGAAAEGGAVAADGDAAAIGAAGTEPADAVDEAVGVERSLGQRQADALGRLAECALAGGLDRGTAGDRYQVVLHVDAETLTEDAAPSAAEPAGSSGDSAGAGGTDGHAGVPAGTPRPVLRAAGCPGPRSGRQAALAEDGGIRVGQETARRIACDAATVTMRHGPDGGVLDVGRRTRTVSPALRRALAARDGRCRFPGCAARRCDAHHVRHWADGGETALANLVLLCRRHHRAVHEEGFRVLVDGDGATTFLRPDGRPLPEAPDAPDWEGPALAPVERRLADAGVGIDADTAPRWQGERLDVGWAIDVLWRPRAGAPPRPAFPRKRPDGRRRKP